MFGLLQLALLPLVVVAAGRPHIPPISGGKDTPAHAYPWMVDLHRFVVLNRREPGEWKHECGGALLKVPGKDAESDIVLTAAHCLVLPVMGRPGSEYTSLDNLKVALGNHRFSQNESGEEVRNIARMAYTPEYDAPYEKKGGQHDLALIQLDSPVKFSETIRPIDLIEKDRAPIPVGTQCTVAGWGRYRRPIGSSDVLRHVNVTVVDGDTCTKRWNEMSPELKYNKANMLCAGNKMLSTTCDGDSGSPLFWKDNKGDWKVIGVSSFGAANDCNGMDSLPAGYCRVDPYIDWINKQIAEWSGRS